MKYIMLITLYYNAMLVEIKYSKSYLTQLLTNCIGLA